MEVRMNRTLGEYSSLKYGECFVYNSKLYMKTRKVGDYNCVCLNNGEFECIPSGMKIEAVSAYVTVGDYER